MSVVTTDLGPNSSYIVYTSGETIENAWLQFATWVQNHGWEAFDTDVTNATVFRAICKDANTYKYVLMGYTLSWQQNRMCGLE